MVISEKVMSPLWVNLGSLRKQTNCHRIRVNITSLKQAVIASVLCYRQLAFKTSTLLTYIITYMQDKEDCGMLLTFVDTDSHKNDTLTIGFESFYKMAHQYNHKYPQSDLTRVVENNLSDSITNQILQLALKLVIIFSSILINVISLGLIMTSPKMDYNHLWVGFVTYILILKLKNMMHQKTTVKPTLTNGIPYMPNRFKCSTLSWITQYLSIDLAILILLWFDFESQFALLLNWHFYVYYGLAFLLGSILINGLKTLITINFINN